MIAHEQLVIHPLSMRLYGNILEHVGTRDFQDGRRKTEPAAMLPLGKVVSRVEYLFRVILNSVKRLQILKYYK